MEETESRTTDVVQEEGKPGEAGRSCNPCDQSLSPSPPILGSRGADTQPKQGFTKNSRRMCYACRTQINSGLIQSGVAPHRGSARRYTPLPFRLTILLPTIHCEGDAL
jgi:hypothetical protein